MRADARRNRERIIDAALGLFAERGPGAAMEEIARAAGLGVGTLYRHFPDRRALVEEIAVGALQDLRAEVRALEALDVPRGQVLERLVAYCAGQPFALIKALAEEDAAPAERRELQAEVDGLLEDLARRAQGEGTVRRDIAPREVVELFSTVVCRPGARADDALARVVLDGLRRDPAPRSP
ncbi:TetR/AcrR family transcriptional regulator [Actinomadura rubrisoli]|uniref:TetR/AcrR family transcriptional regulator n=1 Tax=Actinomadura rubrisoli TaxID=2530368 RepID=A0A4R5BFC7_9ACTN|nr:TetR/AcrR family transcriptional regulator [Actinomadura rubrisoli]TDD83566.1 TetR/AcrR family transcriptional regulator [Actinomadura rubrisoli]